MHFRENNLPSAGWFPDPHDPRQLRYWDGQSWTDHRAPAQQPKFAPKRHWYVSRWALAAGAFILGAAAVSLGTDDSPQTRTAGSPQTSKATETVTVTATPEADPPARSESPGPTQSPAGRTQSPEPAPAPPVAKPAPRRAATFLVTSVVDGDTIELGNGESVRVVGIDTPERGACGYEQATANMERLVLGKRVRLGMSDEDRDRYGRLLRYVDVGRVDVGLRQIEAGLAIARYDSRDGYGYHPRENRYIAADKATPDKTCAKPKPAPLVQAPAQGAGCAPGYDPCVPPFPPDVNCPDVNGPVRVTGPDPHGLDRDGDGIACE